MTNENDNQQEVNTAQITIVQGVSGYFAVLVHRNHKGIWETLDTCHGVYVTKEAAAVEAMEWSEAIGVPYKE